MVKSLADVNLSTLIKFKNNSHDGIKTVSTFFLLHQTIILSRNNLLQITPVAMGTPWAQLFKAWLS